MGGYGADDVLVFCALKLQFFWHAISFTKVGEIVCVCVPIALPVNISAGTVTVGLAAEAVPAKVVKAKVPLLLVVNFVPTLVTAAVPFVPVGVPALVAPLVRLPPVVPASDLAATVSRM